MFPQGFPGIGLLLLRIAVALEFFLEAIRFSPRQSTVFIAIASLVALISISLTIGFLTPYLAIVVCLAHVVALLLGVHTVNLVFVLSIIDSAALILLGPGAYSVDARLFGLRVTVLPLRK